MESNWLCLVLVVLWSTTHLSTAEPCAECEYVEVKDTAYLHHLKGRYQIMSVGCEPLGRDAYRQEEGRNYLFYQDSRGAGSFEGWVIGANLCNFSTVEMRVRDEALSPGSVTRRWKEYYMDEWQSTHARVPCVHHALCDECKHVEVKNTAYLPDLEGKYEVTTQECDGRMVYKKDEGTKYKFMYYNTDSKGWLIGPSGWCSYSSAEMRVHDQAVSPGHVVEKWEEYYRDQWWSTNARVLCVDDGQLSGGEIAWIVIGVIAAAALIGGGIALWFYKKKMKKGAVGDTAPASRPATASRPAPAFRPPPSGPPPSYSYSKY